MLSSIPRIQTLIQPPRTPGMEQDLPRAVLHQLGLNGSLVMSPQLRSLLNLPSQGMKAVRQPGCRCWTAPFGKHLGQCM